MEDSMQEFKQQMDQCMKQLEQQVGLWRKEIEKTFEAMIEKRIEALGKKVETIVTERETNDSRFAEAKSGQPSGQIWEADQSGPILLQKLGLNGQKSHSSGPTEGQNKQQSPAALVVEEDEQSTAILSATAVTVENPLTTTDLDLEETPMLERDQNERRDIVSGAGGEYGNGGWSGLRCGREERRRDTVRKMPQAADLQPQMKSQKMAWLGRTKGRKEGYLRKLLKNKRAFLQFFGSFVIVDSFTCFDPGGTLLYEHVSRTKLPSKKGSLTRGLS